MGGAGPHPPTPCWESWPHLLGSLKLPEGIATPNLGWGRVVPVPQQCCRQEPSGCANQLQATEKNRAEGFGGAEEPRATFPTAASWPGACGWALT